MYEKVSTDLNFVDREKNIGKFWRNQKIFEKSMEKREGSPTYTFYDEAAYREWKAAYWACIDTCYQGYDTALQDYEGIYGPA